MYPSFSIVIPNFNGEQLLKKSLHHLLIAINNTPQSQFEVILVDNGSTDESQKIFKKILKATPHQVIKIKSNLGFAAAVNNGIKSAKYPYVCILNNDLYLKPNWFSLIAKAIFNNQDQLIRTFCGTILDKFGLAYESQGIDFRYSGKCIQLSHGYKYTKSDYLPNRLVWGSSAAAVVYDRQVIQDLGLFDELFFAYLEDVDLSYRLFKAGFKTLLVTNAISLHLGGGTSDKMGNFRAKMTLINWYRFILKNYELKEIIMHLPSITIERLRNLSYFIRASLIL